MHLIPAAQITTEPHPHYFRLGNLLQGGVELITAITCPLIG